MAFDLDLFLFACSSCGEHGGRETSGDSILFQESLVNYRSVIHNVEKRSKTIRYSTIKIRLKIFSCSFKSLIRSWLLVENIFEWLTFTSIIYFSVLL